MDAHDERVKKHQQESLEKLRREMKAAEQKQDPLRPGRRQLISGLALARIRQKLSQADLAAKAGTTQSVISRVENGRGNPSLNTLLAIARALGVNLVVE